MLQASLQAMMDQCLDREKRRTIPWPMWTIWKNRNSILYARVQESITTIVQKDFEEANLWFLRKLLFQTGNFKQEIKI